MATNKELIQYIRQSIDNKISIPEIRETLLNAGWDENSVEMALSETLPNYQSPLLKEKQEKLRMQKYNILFWGIFIFLTVIIILTIFLLPNKNKKDVPINKPSIFHELTK